MKTRTARGSSSVFMSQHLALALALELVIVATVYHQLLLVVKEDLVLQVLVAYSDVEGMVIIR